MKIVFLACLVWLPFMNCTCRIDVLSTEGNKAGPGMYFYFNKKQLPELKSRELKFKATNARTGKTGQVVVWDHKYAWTKGNLHGRWNGKARYGDWIGGDAIIIKDRHICKKEMRCTGQDDGCCTRSRPCDLGEGDCDYHSECAGSLKCGTDNCPWGDADDCCMPA